MTIKEKNFWLDTVTMPSPEPQQALPPKVDVAVLGSGFTGLSAARELAKRGAKVAVLEAETIGWGASSRNAGMVLTGLKAIYGGIIKNYGRETAHRMFAANMASIDCVEQVVKEEKIDCDFSRSGHLVVAEKPPHFDAHAHEMALLDKEFGHKTRVVPRADMRDEIGSDIYCGGFVDEASVGVNPARLVGGLGRAALAAGAAVHERARVTAAEREGAGFRVRTSRGDVHADAVVVATCSYTGGFAPQLQRKIISLGSYIIVTEPLAPAVARDVSPRNRMMFDLKNYVYYFRLTPDNRMLFGGRAAFFPESKSTVRRSAKILRRGMVSVFPQLRDVRVEYAWGGMVEFAFDKMQHTGQMGGLYYALGYGGHGVAMAVYIGAQLAKKVNGETYDDTFEGYSFPDAPPGLNKGQPWFLPCVGAWYKFLDWVR
ncbi:MAG: FAD-binding oxidoreductase [Acidobacteriota bacterium]|nr:MAG: FAD-binding oxidoreductase [Acidobacteriota bacterium]